MVRVALMLPVFEIAADLRAAMAAGDRARVLLKAPTGSGKSTSVPGMLLDAGLAGRILVVEPRRMAARLLAGWVARQRNATLGQEVGYAVRFDTRYRHDTRILYLTDGVFQPSQEDSEGQIKITYPGGFNLLGAEELAKLGAEIQAFVAAAGDLPTFEVELLCAMQRAALPGLDPKVMDAIEDEAEQAIQRAAEAKAQGREAGLIGLAALEQSGEMNEAGETTGEVEGEGQIKAEGTAKNAVPEDPITTPPAPSYTGPQ